MDNKEKHIEKLFQEAFESFELQTDQNDFDAIQRKLRRQNRKKFFWWFFPVLLLLSSGIYFLSNSHQGLQHETSEKTEDNFVEEKKPKTQEPKTGKTLNRTVQDSEQVAISHGNMPEGEWAWPAKNKNDGMTISISEEVISGESLHSKAKKKEEKFNHFRDVHSLILLYPADLNPEIFHTPQENIIKMLEQVLEPQWAKLTPPVQLSGLDKTPPHSFWLGVQGMSGQSNPSFRSASEALLDASNNSTVSGPVRSAGLDLQWRKNNWQNSFGAGLLELQSFTSEVKLQLYDSVPVLNPPGDTIGFFRFNYRDSSLGINRYNRYQYIHVPVKVGRNWSIGPKNRLYTGVGLSWMHLIGLDTRNINPNLQSIDMNNDRIVKNNAISWQLELGYKRKIGDRWEVGAGLIYLRPAAGIHNADAPTRLEIPSTNMYFGIQYRISSTKSSGL